MTLPDQYTQGMTPDIERIPEAILYLISKKSGLSQYQIVKTLFVADTAHLNKFGRPITFDNYYALTFGPVPQLAYDALKPGFDYRAIFGEDRPWQIKRTAGKKNFHSDPSRAPRLELLSASDIEILDVALGVILKFSFKQIKALTHDHPAWQEAWARRGHKSASPMRTALLLNVKDEEYAHDLEYISAHAEPCSV